MIKHSNIHIVFSFTVVQWLDVEHREASRGGWILLLLNDDREIIISFSESFEILRFSVNSGIKVWLHLVFVLDGFQSHKN